MRVEQFAAWLATTDLSVFFQTNLSLIPATQTVHILALSAAGGALLMIAFRVMWDTTSGRSLVDVARQFFPWIFGAIIVLLLSGSLLVIAEPMRSLTNVMFWTKMGLVSLLSLGLWGLQRQTATERAATTGKIHLGTSMQLLVAILVCLFIAIIFAGRWIAYTPSWANY